MYKDIFFQNIKLCGRNTAVPNNNMPIALGAYIRLWPHRTHFQKSFFQPITMDVIPVTFACLLAGKYHCEGRNRKCCK